MKALISPNEVFEFTYIESYVDGQPKEITLVGERIVDFSEEEFEVVPPLFWIDCPQNVASNPNLGWYYKDNSFHEIPTSATPPDAVAFPLPE